MKKSTLLPTRQLALVGLTGSIMPQRRQQKRVDLAFVQHCGDIGHTRAGGGLCIARWRPWL